MHFVSTASNDLSENSVSYLNKTEEATQPQAPGPLSLELFSQVITIQTITTLEPKDFKLLFGLPKNIENMNKALQSGEENPGFVQYANACLEKAIQTIMDMALEGKIDQAYNMIYQFAGFNEEEKAFITNGRSSDEIKEVMPQFLRQRFMFIPDMNNLLQFVSNAKELHQARTRGSLGLNMVDAQNLYQELDILEGNMTAGQKAKLYFLGAEVFRKANYIPGSYGEPPACDSELRCLQKALLNTSDLKIVTCCYDRMKQQIPYFKKAQANVFADNNHNFIDAYQRVLENSNHPEDHFKAYGQIASLYIDKIDQHKISIQQRDYRDTANLQWAEYYLRQAYKKSPQEYRLEAINNLLSAQKLLGNEEKIIKTKEERLKYLPTKDRINALIDLSAEHSALKGDKPLKRAWRELGKADLDPEAKAIISGKIEHFMRQISKDKKFISSVEKNVANRKQTPNKELVRKQSTRE